jgi:hypothetical protein
MRADSNWQLAIDLCISSQQSIQKTAKGHRRRFPLIRADQEEVAANFREGTRIKNESRIKSTGWGVLSFLGA